MGSIENLAEEWAVSSNKALSLSLVAPTSTISFSPVFTYPIFGDAETIYGFKDLSINLSFDCASLYPLLTCSWSQKLLDDIEDPCKTLKEYLPEYVATNEEEWKDKIQEENFEIPGTKVDSFKDNEGDEFVVYRTTFADIKSKTLHERMQIFILLFIEAGSYIDEDDDHWELFLLYKKQGSNNFFAGFCTVYQYFWYKNAELHDNVPEPFTSNLRKRISQFVILPLYQGRGVGGKFYSTLISLFLNDNAVKEISVEDPSEAFDDLRDRCDLTRLSQNETWSLNKDFYAARITPEWIEETRERNKMTPRQFERCIEMALLKLIDQSQDTQKRYRLLVKRRLYFRNREHLDEMTPEERKDKLQETFEVLKEDYLRIISKVNLEADITAKRPASSLKDELPEKKQKVES